MLTDWSVSIHFDKYTSILVSVNTDWSVVSVNTLR